MEILLSNSQAGPGRTVKQEQEEISRNHVQAFIPGSVLTLFLSPPHKQHYAPVNSPVSLRRRRVLLVVLIPARATFAVRDCRSCLPSGWRQRRRCRRRWRRRRRIRSQARRVLNTKVQEIKFAFRGTPGFYHPELWLMHNLSITHDMRHVFFVLSDSATIRSTSEAAER